MINLPYEGIELNELIKIDRLYSVHYFEYARDFVFEGESHDFWEFVCVDRGEISVASGEERLSLSKDMVAFHEPGEFHDVRAAKNTAPDLMVVSFSCKREAMEYFRKKVFTMDKEEKELLGLLLREARNVFSNRLDDPYTYELVADPGRDNESEQLLLLYLKTFLLHLMRRTRKEQITGERHGLISERLISGNDTEEKYRGIRRYMENHLDGMVSVAELCEFSSVSRSQLFSIFKIKEECGPIEFFNKLKIERAKLLIRQTDLRFSQIAVKLGFSSLYYFSRVFKAVTGMSPSEYSKSIKALSEKSK
ncbi:MAG: AraC family transcriptional regulator [Eubacteriales bacterium]|nr:AraC family transcriptional regulator [Eubacteriales bacterium]